VIEFLKIHEQVKATATNIEEHEIKVLNEKQRNLDDRFQQIKKKLNAANIASNLRYRYSDDYMPEQKKNQDFLEGTENLSFDRYLIGLRHGTNEIKEFRFSDNSSVKVPTSWGDSNFKDYNINPSDSIVKTAKIWYNTSGGYVGNASGIELLDNQGRTLLKVGPSGDTPRLHTVELKDNERIIGFRSGKRGSPYAIQYDF
jgi:hypothetical protein